MGLKIGSGIPCFSKVWFKPLHFYKRPTFVPVFANNNNNKKSKDDFNFYKKKKKKEMKAAFSVFSAAVNGGIKQP